MTKKILKLIILIQMLSVFFVNADLVSDVYAETQGPAMQSGAMQSSDVVVILGQQIDTSSLNGFVQLMIAASKWILGISGAATLLMFVYGGIMFLISAGSSQRVDKAKQIIFGAVAGLVIIFSSYIIIGFAISTLGIKDTGWASSGWWPSK